MRHANPKKKGTTKLKPETHPLVAGQINDCWLEDVERNSGRTEELFSEYLNVDVKIDKAGSVWIGARWLTQPEIDSACKAIDRGI